MKPIKLGNLSLVRGNLNPCFLGMSLKGEGEPTVESLQAELKTANEKIAGLEKTAGDWKGAIDPDHANNPRLTRFETPKAMFESYVSLEEKLGKDKIVIPKDQNDTAAWGDLAKAIGVPATKDDYKFTEVKLPDGMPADAAQEGKFRELAHKYHLAPWQADGLRKEVLEANAETFTKLTADATENAQKVETDLQKEFGSAWPEKKELAQKVIDKYAPEAHELSGKILADPAAIRMLIGIGEKFGEDGLIDAGGGAGRLSPQEARAKINQILGDDKHPYNVDTDPGHKEAVDYMTQLYEMEAAGA